MSHQPPSAESRWPIWFARSLVFALSLGQPVIAAPVQPVLLSLQAQKRALLAGEPIVLAVTVEATIAVQLDRGLNWPEAPLRILVDRGQGFTRYLAKSWVSGWRKEDRGATDGPVKREYVLGFDALVGDWPLAVPGTYRLVAEYQDSIHGRFRSDAEVLTVVAPTGAEKTVHDELRRLGVENLGLDQLNRLSPELTDLVRRFPESAYLQVIRLNDLDAQVSTVTSGYDPFDARASTDPSRRQDNSAATIRSRLGALLPAAREIAAIPGQFQADALLLLAGIHAGIGNEGTALETHRRILNEFPGRTAADLAREEVGDSSPPSIEISTAERSLWSPNKKLVPISVTVMATDDSGSAPSIKLVSITCNDACNPAQDITEAAFGTDDRAFKLRADRTGGGNGRTYTITYEATDAAGNKTTATTTVTVPHDKGKK